MSTGLGEFCASSGTLNPTHTLTHWPITGKQMDGQTDGRTDRRTDEQMDRWKASAHECVIGNPLGTQTVNARLTLGTGQTDGQTDRQTDGQIKSNCAWLHDWQSPWPSNC